MHAVVTGAAGFLGSHLCERLLKEGFNVLGMDSLQTGTLANLASFRANCRFHFKKHDVTRPYNEKADWFFNLACPASPVHYQKDPLRTLRTSLWGAEHACLNALRCHGRLLQASTSEVYGDPLEHPQTESYWGHVNPIGPRACYDEGKRAAETLCVEYHRQQGLDLRIVRIFNTYGPRMAIGDGRVVSNFIVQALRGEDLTVFGDGSQTRAFCYVDDLIEGFMRMMRQEGEVGPVNLGNPGEFTVLELAQKVLALTGSKSRLVFKELPGDDPKQRKPDIHKAERVLNSWSPQIPLEEGLQRTIAYFKTTLV
jgi:UDP-glucuronate decarboxylase